MEYLQYFIIEIQEIVLLCFKPCYKWNTFNTCQYTNSNFEHCGVLNLVINGIPSIQNPVDALLNSYGCFKPCYKWNTFNTVGTEIIVGAAGCFKPCYKWNTFNTNMENN